MIGAIGWKALGYCVLGKELGAGRALCPRKDGKPEKAKLWKNDEKLTAVWPDCWGNAASCFKIPITIVIGEPKV